MASLVLGSPQPDLASNFRVHLTEYLNTRKVLEVVYPELYFPEFFPAASYSNEIPEGSTDFSFPIKDWKGRAALRATGSEDIPLITSGFTKISTPIFHS